LGFGGGFFGWWRELSTGARPGEEGKNHEIKQVRENLRKRKEGSSLKQYHGKNWAGGRKVGLQSLRIL